MADENKESVKTEGLRLTIAEVAAIFGFIVLMVYGLISLNSTKYEEYIIPASVVADSSAENGVYTTEDGKEVGILSDVSKLRFSMDNHHIVYANVAEFFSLKVWYYSEHVTYGYDECKALDGVIVEVLPNSRIKVREPMSMIEGDSMSDKLNTDEFLNCLRLALYEVQDSLPSHRNYLAKQREETETRKESWGELTAE